MSTNTCKSDSKVEGRSSHMLQLANCTALANQEGWKRRSHKKIAKIKSTSQPLLWIKYEIVANEGEVKEKTRKTRVRRGERVEHNEG